MSMPDYQSLVLPVLEIGAKGESLVPLAADEIAARLGLTNEEREQMLPSGKQRVLHNRPHWAKFYLTKAGLLESPKRGRFLVSDAGRRVLASPPTELNTKYLLAIPAFRDFYRGEDEAGAGGSVMDAEPPVATPEEVVDAAYKALQAALRDELLGRILQNSPAFFEQLIVELLVAMGYGGSRLNAEEQLGKSGDGGVDGVINEDVLGLDRVYVHTAMHHGLRRQYGTTSSVVRSELSVVENLVRPYGTAGSTRLDIYHRVEGTDTICAYDIKTGTTGLSAAQAARIYATAHAFGQRSGNIANPRVLVIELRRTP